MDDRARTLRLLCVCLGNICRSPTAEAVLRSKASARGLELFVDSAGTGDWHRGEPPYPPMIAAAAKRGYDLSELRARCTDARDFEAFDVILTMDERNQADVEARRPAGIATLVRPFSDQGPIPDPYYTRDFDETLDRVEAAADALLDQLQNASAVAPKFL